MQGNLNDLLKNLPPELARTVARYGVRLAIDLLETFYADLGNERGPEESKPVRKKLGRPPKVPKEEKLPKVTLAAVRKSGWPADPQARKREMARRIEVRAAKVRAERRTAGARKRWENMSAAQKQAWLRNMQRGRKRAKHAKTDNEEAAA
jgi:hypothetical protein